MMGEINVADLFAISIIQHLNIELYRTFRDNNILLLSYDDHTRSLRISSSYRSVFEHPIFAKVTKNTNTEEQHF